MAKKAIALKIKNSLTPLFVSRHKYSRLLCRPRQKRSVPKLSLTLNDSINNLPNLTTYTNNHFQLRALHHIPFDLIVFLGIVLQLIQAVAQYRDKGEN